MIRLVFTNPDPGNAEAAMPALNLIILNDTFSIHRLACTADIPGQVFSSPFFAVTRTDYILLKDSQFQAACEALRAAGYTIAK